MSRTYQIQQVLLRNHLVLKLVFFENGEEVSSVIDAFSNRAWCVDQGEKFLNGCDRPGVGHPG